MSTLKNTRIKPSKAQKIDSLETLVSGAGLELQLSVPTVDFVYGKKENGMPFVLANAHIKLDYVAGYTIGFKKLYVVDNYNEHAPIEHLSPDAAHYQLEQLIQDSLLMEVRPYTRSGSSKMPFLWYCVSSDATEIYLETHESPSLDLKRQLYALFGIKDKPTRKENKILSQWDSITPKKLENILSGVLEYPKHHLEGAYPSDTVISEFLSSSKRVKQALTKSIIDAQTEFNERQDSNRNHLEGREPEFFECIVELASMMSNNGKILLYALISEIGLDVFLSTFVKVNFVDDLESLDAVGFVKQYESYFIQWLEEFAQESQQKDIFEYFSKYMDKDTFIDIVVKGNVENPAYERKYKAFAIKAIDTIGEAVLFYSNARKKDD